MFNTQVTQKTPYTLQSAFDRIWQFFVIERHPPAYDGGCRYRTNTSACAIGCLLPDSTFSEGEIQKDSELLELTVEELLMASNSAAFLLKRIAKSKLANLQSIHDTAACQYSTAESEAARESILLQMKRRLQEFAENHELTVPNEPGRSEKSPA